jgi:hypothetical protein
MDLVVWVVVFCGLFGIGVAFEKIRPMLVRPEQKRALLRRASLDDLPEGVPIVGEAGNELVAFSRSGSDEWSWIRVQRRWFLLSRVVDGESDVSRREIDLIVKRDGLRLYSLFESSRLWDRYFV